MTGITKYDPFADPPLGNLEHPPYLWMDICPPFYRGGVPPWSHKKDHPPDILADWYWYDDVPPGYKIIPIAPTEAGVRH